MSVAHDTVTIYYIDEDNIFNLTRQKIYSDPTITKLVIYLKVTDKPVFESICGLIRECRQIRELRLFRSRNECTPEKILLRLIYKAINKSPNIRHLHVRDLINTVEAGECLAEYLNKSPHIISFHFTSLVGHNNFGGVLNGLRENQHLLELELNSMQFVNCNEFESMLNFLRGNKTCRKFKAFVNSYGESRKDIIDAIDTNNTLTNVEFHESWGPKLLILSEHVNRRNSKEYLRNVILITRRLSERGIPDELESLILEYAIDETIVTRHA